MIVGIYLYGSVSATVGIYPQRKSIGVNLHYATNIIKIFPTTTTIVYCGMADPSLPTTLEQQPSLTPPGDAGTCYACVLESKPNHCDNTGPKPGCKANCTTVCLDPKGYRTLYGRTCVAKDFVNKYIVDGEIWKPGGSSTSYDRNLQCGGDISSPDIDALVVESSSKQYMWDDKPPICVRGGFATYASLGNDWKEDVEIQSLVVAGNSGSTDTTLTYTEPSMDAESLRIYRGEWTNRTVQAKGICSDAESGCASTDPVYSTLPELHHLQKTFSLSGATFTDNVNNTIIDPVCPTTTAKLKGISRRCTYIVDPKKINIAIDNYPDWFSSLLSSDSDFLNDIIVTPTLASNVASIKKLRDLSNSGTNSLSAAMGIVPAKHDLLYTFVTGSCMYTPRFGSGMIVPLIDRIKPTISARVQFGSGTFTDADTMLLKQEGTSTPGTAQVHSETGAYVAGSGNITITLIDSGSSTYTALSDWEKWNGVSGIRQYNISICRTVSYTGLTLNNDGCIKDPLSAFPRPHTIYSTGQTIDPYNASGSIIDPHTIVISHDFSDTGSVDGIQVAGTYEIHISMIDAAGNFNTAVVKFDIIPQSLDPSKTVLIKYNDPSVETFATTIYTTVGSDTTLPGGAIIATPRYANAMDIQTYKLSLFDIYNNPIYLWNLYNYKLTQTGISLDQVKQIGPSALFVNPIGGILSNSGQTVKTNADGALKFHILSYTPGEFREQFQFNYKNRTRLRVEAGTMQSYTFPHTSQNSQTGSFRHILTGAIDLYTTDRIDLGTANDIRLNFFTTSPTENTTLAKFTVSNFLESIISLTPQHFIITNTGVLIPGTALSYNSGFIFNSSPKPYYPNPNFLTGAIGSFIPEQIGGVFTDSLKIKSFPYITLTFSGYTTQYYMSERQDKYSSGITYQTGVLNRIYVEGLTSTVGKDGYVNMKENVDVNSANARNEVHKNVALLTRNRTNSTTGGIVNRIKYLTGDVNSMSLVNDMDKWDVLIINGGNLTIGKNYTENTTVGGGYIPYEERNYYFNSGTTSFDRIPHKGIIVLKNEYTGSGGNIYIKPDVRFIGASLFADESIHSVRYDGTRFSRSNSARTFLLNKQLIIFGSIFSKNTIGGAVRANSAGQYILPWNKTATVLDQAVDYDLSFLRMDNVGYRDLPLFLHRGRTEFVVILTDPRNTSHPLPGFMSKK